MSLQHYLQASPDQIDPAARKAMNAALKQKRFPLLLSGDVGTGKSCAAACVFKAFRESALREGAPVPHWYRADELLLSMATGRVDGVSVQRVNEFGESVRAKISFEAFCDRLAGTTCLVLDDLGTRRPTEPMYGALFELMEARAGRAMVITSNKSLGELAAMFDQRIADRFKAGDAIVFRGASRRTRGRVLKVQVPE